MIHALEQADVLGTAGQEIAVVLHADEDAAGGGILGALTEVIGDPAFNNITRSATRDRLPLLRRDIRVGEDAQHRRAELHADLHPILDALLAFGAQGFVGRGDLVLHAAAADLETKTESLMLDGEDLGVGRNLGIAGEEVAREVDCVEARFGGEVEQLAHRHPLRVVRLLQSEVQLDVERVRVERSAQARDLGSRGGVRGAGGETERGKREPGGVL